MILRGLFLMDGPSDAPIADHLEWLCAAAGKTVRIAAPDLRRLPGVPVLTVEARMRAAWELDDDYQIVFVHRDAETQAPHLRFQEVRNGVDAVVPGHPAVPVVPIRMTEAWLLLDEAEIRRVAGRPTGVAPLHLPPADQVEQAADPKAILGEALVRAAGVRGRRLRQFRRRFGDHRRLLLNRLDSSGPVNNLVAWQQLKTDIGATFSFANTAGKA